MYEFYTKENDNEDEAMDLDVAHRCYRCAFKHAAKARFLSGSCVKEDNVLAILDISSFISTLQLELQYPEYRNLDHLSLYVGALAAFEDAVYARGGGTAQETDEIRFHRTNVMQYIFTCHKDDVHFHQIESFDCYDYVPNGDVDMFYGFTAYAERVHAHMHLPVEFDRKSFVWNDPSDEDYLKLLKQILVCIRKEEEEIGEEER